MRAHWVKDLSIQDSYVLQGESLHHLVNVVRVEIGEDLLLLNGKGLMVLTIVEAIGKRELKLQFKEQYIKESDYKFDLVLGMPKREALELCLKEATELGFRRIFLIRSDYSQMRFPEKDRVEKLLVSAMEQSNAPYLPEVIESHWNEVPWGDYGEIVLMDSQTTQAAKASSGHEVSKLLVVGPEGGFSPDELARLHGLKGVRVIHLPTPILRTPTAVAVGAGLMIQSLLN